MGGGGDAGGTGAGLSSVGGCCLVCYNLGFCERKEKEGESPHVSLT